MQKIEINWQELPYALREEMKVLRTNLKFSGADKRVIMMTSAASHEGKSSVCLNLCVSLAELGHRVLLVDADMRKSMLKHKVKRGDVSVGLSHFLSGQRSLDSVFCETDNPLVFLVPAGAAPPNPSELLNGQYMTDLIKWARDQFDYVIVDCPPLGLVTDAAVVAPVCDGAIILLEWGAIRYTMAQEVLLRLRTTQVPILGVIMNKVDVSSGRYYRRYGYGKYGYSRYSYGKYGRYGYGKYGYYKEY